MGLLTKNNFSTEFSRCCNEYSSLKMATAWCGNPSHILPYSLIVNGNLSVNVILGVEFNQTHPEAIKYFINNKIPLRVINPKAFFFHPKIYLFKNKTHYAAFIGSSNFTYNGFYNNVEINMIIEGVHDEEMQKIESLFIEWSDSKNSFKPTQEWLDEYELVYRKTLSDAKGARIKTPPVHEEDITSSVWLTKASWDVYYKKLIEGIESHETTQKRCLAFFQEVSDSLTLPLTESIFDDIQNRRIIGGMGRYGWLGHVAASGGFRKFMANGSSSDKRQAVDAINAICKFSFPFNTLELKRHLQSLEALGPSIKVWSRVISIIRPDLFSVSYTHLTLPTKRIV